MAWKILFTKKAEKDFADLDKSVKERILKYLSRISDTDPKSCGEQLTGNWQGCWRFRVGDYRLITEIIEQDITIHVIKIGHRREVY